MIKLSKRLLQGEALEKQAEELGVSQMDAGFASGLNNDAILQKRVIEAKRARREPWLWLIAFIASIASVFSALAAWYAVFSKCTP